LKPGKGRDIVETDIAASRLRTVINPRTGKPEIKIEGDVELSNPTIIRRK
jgi:hypothetical protein